MTGGGAGARRWGKLQECGPTATEAPAETSGGRALHSPTLWKAQEGRLVARTSGPVPTSRSRSVERDPPARRCGPPAACPAPLLARFWQVDASALDTLLGSTRWARNRPAWDATSRGDLRGDCLASIRSLRTTTSPRNSILSAPIRPKDATWRENPTGGRRRTASRSCSTGCLGHPTVLRPGAEESHAVNSSGRDRRPVLCSSSGRCRQEGA